MISKCADSFTLLQHLITFAESQHQEIIFPVALVDIIGEVAVKRHNVIERIKLVIPALLKQ